MVFVVLLVCCGVFHWLAVDLLAVWVLVCVLLDCWLFSLDFDLLL